MKETMKKSILLKSTLAVAATSMCLLGLIFWDKMPDASRDDVENDMYDGPAMAAEFEFERTKDPATGTVPNQQLLIAIDRTTESKDNDAQFRGITLGADAIGHRLVQSDETARQSNRAEPAQIFAPSALTWSERGPNSDVSGPSNGNTRANGGIPSGRIRAMMVDSSDVTGKTVWIGGVDGGLWKTSDITVSPAAWTLVSDNLSNLAVSDIFQQVGNPDTIYFSTGEGYFNGDAVAGNGVFKSIDHGVTWTQLPGTRNFTCNRITGDETGVLYLATTGNGVLRSIDGGILWTVITPTSSSARIADMELSSTGRLHITTGLGTSTIGVYRFTDSPATVDAGAWSSATTPFPYPSGATCRVELGASGNTLYALPSNTSAQVPALYKSTDGGVTWAAVPAPSANWASGQAWYSLSIGINPTDADQVIIGGLDTWKSTNGGTSWTQMSTWVGTTPVNQYVHADQHKVIWYDGGNKLIFGSDGGVFYSADGGTTIRDRNVGLRLKQFYSVAMHPSTTNYFLAGAQDNGTHQLTNAGLGSSVEVTGGDGAFVAIDQNEPQFQFGAYIFNQYRRSTNGGANWSSINLSSTAGRFINPFDYENTANIMYCADAAASYRRWTNPQTGNSSAVVGVSNLVGNVTAVSVSPYTTNRVYFGTNSGKIVMVDGADTFVSGGPGTDLSAGLPGGTVSNVSFGTNDSNLIACESNYGIISVWVSTDGGITWTGSDGNLPDMPVRWAMFKPGDNTKAFIATETGVWETNLLNGASTVWTANSTFPTVRTDMIKYRGGDGTIAAATHGRGLWTATLAAANVTVSGTVTAPDGRGLRNAQVFYLDADGVKHLAITTSFGVYRFDSVLSGRSYLIGVSSKRYRFQSATVQVDDNLAGVNFVGVE